MRLRDGRRRRPTACSRALGRATVEVAVRSGAGLGDRCRGCVWIPVCAPRSGAGEPLVGDWRDRGGARHSSGHALDGAAGIPPHPSGRRRGLGPSRHGIQQTLIAVRLNLAVERGIRVATIGSRPGTGTERNGRRMGFQTACTKCILARPGPGLIPVREQRRWPTADQPVAASSR